MSETVEIQQSLYSLPTEIEEAVARLEMNELSTQTSETVEAITGPHESDQETFSSPLAFWRYRDQLPQEQSESENQLDEFSSHVERFEQYAGFCDNILEKMDGALGMLANLKHQHHLVSKKTSSLHATCNKLLAEQSLLDKNLDAIRAPMKHFRLLGELAPLLGQQFDESVTKIDEDGRSTPKNRNGNSTNTTTSRIVSPRDMDRFKDILAKLDGAIAFMDSHVDYRDSQVFGEKLRHLRFRGLTMLRDHVIDSIRATADSVINGLRVEQHSTSDIVAHNTYSSLLYVRFRALTKELQPLVSEIEVRVPLVAHERTLDGLDETEYNPNDLLTDLHVFYCNQRSRLLHGYVTTIVNQPIASGTSPNDHQMLTQGSRAIVPQLRRLCLDEFELFGTLFLKKKQLLEEEVSATENEERSMMISGRSILIGGDTMPDAYNDSMIALCTSLYDVLRPTIVQENVLENLCVAVRVLQDEILEAMLLPHGAAGYPIQYVVQLLMNDVKEKLALCADKSIRDDILSYSATEDDINYPDKLLVLSQESPETTKDKPKEVRAFGWYYYTTVYRTLGLLSNVYRLVDMSIFEDLMERAVSGCTASLLEAANAIEKKSTAMDAQLFLVKQLLILREQITGFVTTTQHVTEKRLDFATTTAAFKELMIHRGMLFTLSRRNALLELVQHGVPTVHEDQINCKVALESQLRNTCQQFRLGATNQLLGQLLPFLDRARAFSRTSSEKGGSENTAPSFDLANQEFAAFDRVLKLLLETKGTLVPHMRTVLDQMAIYLRNPDTGVIPETRAILFGPIPTQVFAVLNDIRGIISGAYTPEQTAELVSLLDAIRASVAGLSQASATGNQSPSITSSQEVTTTAASKDGNDLADSAVVKAQETSATSIL